MSLQMRQFRALDRRRRVAALYARGRGQKEIAELLGVDQGTVSRDLESVRELWKKTARQDYQELCGWELKRIELLERTAWETWDEEHADLESKGGEQKSASKSRWKYLELILRCISQRRRLLALDAPARSSKSPKEESLFEEIERGRVEIDELYEQIFEPASADAGGSVGRPATTDAGGSVGRHATTDASGSVGRPATTEVTVAADGRREGSEK